MEKQYIAIDLKSFLPLLSVWNGSSIRFGPIWLWQMRQERKDNLPCGITVTEAVWDSRKGKIV